MESVPLTMERFYILFGGEKMELEKNIGIKEIKNIKKHKANLRQDKNYMKNNYKKLI